MDGEGVRGARRGHMPWASALDFLFVLVLKENGRPLQALSAAVPSAGGL